MNGDSPGRPYPRALLERSVIHLFSSLPFGQVFPYLVADASGEADRPSRLGQRDLLEIARVARLRRVGSEPALLRNRELRPDVFRHQRNEPAQIMGLRGINVPRSKKRLDRLLDALLRMETYRIRRAFIAQGQRVGCGLQVVFRFDRPFANNLNYAFTVWHRPLSLPAQRAFRSFLRSLSAKQTRQAS